MKRHSLSAEELELVKQMLYTGILTHKAIAKRIGCSSWLISHTAVREGIRRGRGPLSPAHPDHKVQETV
jgi:hypothetical protein